MTLTQGNSWLFFRATEKKEQEDARPKSGLALRVRRLVNPSKNPLDIDWELDEADNECTVSPERLSYKGGGAIS